jgi:hypothetical protein
MVENTNSTTLEVQGSFALTYMVGFILLNLKSQEMEKGVPHARARRRPGVAGGRGVVDMASEVGQGSRSSERMRGYRGYDQFISLLFYILHMFIPAVLFIAINLSNLFCRIIS